MKRMIRPRKLNLGTLGFLTLAGVVLLACLMMSSGNVVVAQETQTAETVKKVPLMFNPVNSWSWGNAEYVLGYVAETEVPGTERLIRNHSKQEKYIYEIHKVGAEGRDQLRKASERSYSDDPLVFDGVVGYIAKTPLSGTKPLYRMSKDNLDYHTTDRKEAEKFTGDGWQTEILGYIWEKPTAEVDNSQTKGKGSPKSSGRIFLPSLPAIPQSYDLLCRGDDNVAKRFSVETGANAKLMLHFEKGNAPGRRESLLPGQCSWLDRGMRENEPNTIVHNIAGGSEHDPPYQWYAVLRGSDGYWVFSVFNDNGVLRVTGSRSAK